MVSGGHETGREWIEALPAELDGQKAIMASLLDWCEADERARYLVVACSVGRGAADRLSDLDMGMGLESPDFDAALADAHQVIDRAGGELVDSYHHKIPGLAMPHERIFAQYANRCQVDVVVIPASEKYPGVKDEVVLYDPESIRAAKWVASEVTPTQVREWAFNGWACLADVGKYLRRGSAWEALERLHQARAEYWRLLAAVHDVPNPQYGITSLLDFAPAKVPPSLAATASDVYLTHLLRAARNLAAELAGVGTQLPPEFREVLPNAMAAFITADLELIEAELRPRCQPGGTTPRNPPRKVEPVLPSRRPTWQDQTRAILLRRVDDRPQLLPASRPGRRRSRI